MFIMIALLFSTSCGIINQDSTSDKKADKTFTSEDGTVQLIASEDWNTSNKLNEQAILLIANPAKEKYLIVIDESKADFAKDANVSDYASLILDGMKQAVKNISVSEPTKVTVNNYPGLQYTIQGEVEKLKVSYYITLIETPETFSQVVAWSLQSKFDSHKEEFKAITSTFKRSENTISAYFIDIGFAY